MTEGPIFPPYIPREEERQVGREIARVREEGRSRVLLLSGPGGVGKTWFLRELAGKADPAGSSVWLPPIDLDDSEYWLLSNLERRVAEHLDPENHWFGRYREYISRLPRYMRPHVGRETVLSHLARIKGIFVQCYQRFVEETGKVVVMTLDTVEVIRGMNVLLTVTQWMKALPGTLFILSGRPIPDDRGPDPILDELKNPHHPLPLTPVHLAGFPKPQALAYLDLSAVADALSTDEKEKLVHLTRGHPLWLALTLDYLVEVGIPEEAEAPLQQLVQDVPYEGPMTPKGEALHEEYKRRLVTPYRNGDFGHEATKRLAVVRRRVNQPIWQRLMTGVDLPKGVTSWDDAWRRLRETPWIRCRINRRYVTLHDAVAEELALRIIPVHDQDQRWRRQLWRWALEVHDELINEPEADLSQRLETLLRAQDRTLSPEETSAFIEEITRLDDRKRELDQLKASRLYYQLLSDPEEGCRQFLSLLERASAQHDALFQQLIVLEIQRFLPNGAHAEPSGDVTRGAIAALRNWLVSTRPDVYLEIGLSLAKYLVDNEQADAAMELLSRPWGPIQDARQRYRLGILRGNACTRIPGKVEDAEGYFHQALGEALQLEPRDSRLAAEAYKEMGFYYRAVGSWEKADESYAWARDAISTTPSERTPEDRAEMASIQTNWAYVKALVGRYREALDLVDSAISVRQRLGLAHEEGVSWSVRGEVHRYDHQFHKAWEAYREAERIFQERRSWPWLGLVHQEQAICLFQAAREDVHVGQDPDRDPYEQAEFLITLALNICRDQAVRGYASALNRAGRIYAQKDAETALRYLEEAAVEARRLSDIWFWLASLVEYVELSFQAWRKTGLDQYRERISLREREIGEAMKEYNYPDLKGRWNLLQGHLIVQESLTSRQTTRLPEALRHYKNGFLQIARGFVGSHGTASLPAEFGRLRELFCQLPPETRELWLDQLGRAWQGETSLLARLEQLY